MACNGSNGIGSAVSQYVHARNAARKAGPVDGTTTAPTTGGAAAPTPIDTLQLSAAALEKFAAWKAKMDAHAPFGALDPTPAVEKPSALPAPVVPISPETIADL